MNHIANYYEIHETEWLELQDLLANLPTEKEA